MARTIEDIRAEMRAAGECDQSWVPTSRLETKEHQTVSWPDTDSEEAISSDSLSIRPHRDHLSCDCGAPGMWEVQPSAEHAEYIVLCDQHIQEFRKAPQLTPRERLIAEWNRINPQTPDEIALFYTISQEMRADLDAWHAEPGRQLITDMLVHVASKSGAQRIVDIGCGAGHDLRAMRKAFPDANLVGVEPNHQLVAQASDGCMVYFDSASAPINEAQLLVCIDVLEHLPDPEAFLADIAERAPLGCLLFEATATFDVGTPLHLASNRGWHPGRCLESHGWQVVDTAGAGDRVRVWRREALQAPSRGHLLLCAYRNVTVDSLQSIMALTAGANASWRLKVKHGDSLIGRSRSILVTHWWRTTADDLFLLVDDDITFSPQDAVHLAELCRSGRDIVCGAYPVRNGAHFACRTLQGTEHILFGPGQEPIEIMYAATGFLAVSRRVIDAMITRGGENGEPLPLCNASEPWSFYPLFPTPVVENGDGWELLSEDYGMSRVARRLGFHVWLDPTIILQHAAQIPVSVRNMDAVHAVIEKA